MPARPLILVALAVGVIDGLVFLGFEWVVNHGTDWVWNDLAGTDDARWRVVPLAIGLSVAFSALLRTLGEPRRAKPHVDPLAGTESAPPRHAGDAPPPGAGTSDAPPAEAVASDSPPPTVAASDAPPAEAATSDSPPPTVAGLATILLVGAASLLAGASLGPEASLVALASGLGAWAAAKANLGERSRVLVLASVGALLVAFLGSLIPLAIPLLLMRRKLTVPAVAAVVVAGVAAYATLWLVQGDGDGFGAIPALPVRARDYAAALILGAIAVGLGMALRSSVARMHGLAARVGGPWWLMAAGFGALLGLLYLLGGPGVEFSGSEGSTQLLDGELHYGALALVGIVLVKLAVTGWSLAAGYRGGLVFPSVFVGVAVSLCAAEALPAVAGPGVLLGAIAGLLVEMTNPAAGAIMLLALLPAELLPLGLAGAAGAIAAKAVIKRGS